MDSNEQKKRLELIAQMTQLHKRGIKPHKTPSIDATIEELEFEVAVMNAKLTQRQHLADEETTLAFAFFLAGLGT
jgi:hypothetical protein